VSDLSDLTISDAGAGLRKKDFTSVELLDAVTTRASFTEAQLHAYLVLDRDGSRSAAEAADALLAEGKDLGPLHGIPIALKDNMCTEGLTTTASSQMLAGWVLPSEKVVIFCPIRPRPPSINARAMEWPSAAL
jgi:aspartyl-tRNA(Asn)/glutamyl-tRNA(Gln) amidotransferase subunit A